MKHKKLALLLAPVLGVTLLAAGCAKKVVSIEKTASYDTEDVYTVTYSDGTTSNMVVENGKDGKDGAVSVDELFAKYLETHQGATYDQFLKDYLQVTEDYSAIVGNSLLSCFEVYAEFSSSVLRGSAVLYETRGDDAYIVTNYHVVYGKASTSGWGGVTYGISSKIHCYLFGSVGSPTQKITGGYDYGSYDIPCTYVGGSISSDIAVLKASLAKIHSINPQAKPVMLAATYTGTNDNMTPASYHVGETAFAIGNTEGEGISVTKGIVSVDSEYINLQIGGAARSYRSLRMDTAIYSGNSGGGLFNGKGELIGITNAGDSTDENINYAIPLSIVTGVVDNVIYYANDGADGTNGAYRMSHGMELKAENSRYVYNSATGIGKIVEDIKVSTVSGVASAMGIAANDVIKGMIIQSGSNRVKYTLNRDYEINELLLTVRAGDSIQFVYQRGGTEYTSSAYSVKASNLSKLN